MFLPKVKLDIPRRRLLRRLPNLSRCRVRPTKVHTHFRDNATLQPRQVRLINQPITHCAKQPLKIRTAEVRARFEFGEGVDFGADRVDVDVCGGVLVQSLG